MTGCWSRWIDGEERELVDWKEWQAWQKTMTWERRKSLAKQARSEAGRMKGKGTRVKPQWGPVVKEEKQEAVKEVAVPRNTNARGRQGKKEGEEDRERGLNP